MQPLHEDAHCHDPARLFLTVFLLKTFYQFINFSLSHTVFISVLSQQHYNEFQQVSLLLSQEVSRQCIVFFLTVVHSHSRTCMFYLTLASVRLRAESCTVCVQATNQPLQSYWIASASVLCGYNINFKIAFRLSHMYIHFQISLNFSFTNLYMHSLDFEFP